MDIVWDSVLDRLDRHSLLTCLLVCREWSVLAAKALYRSIPGKAIDQNKWLMLHNILTKQARRIDYAQMVSHLDLSSFTTPDIVQLSLQFDALLHESMVNHQQDPVALTDELWNFGDRKAAIVKSSIRSLISNLPNLQSLFIVDTHARGTWCDDDFFHSLPSTLIRLGIHIQDIHLPPKDDFYLQRTPLKDLYLSKFRIRLTDDALIQFAHRAKHHLRYLCLIIDTQKTLVTPFSVASIAKICHLKHLKLDVLSELVDELTVLSRSNSIERLQDLALNDISESRLAALGHCGVFESIGMNLSRHLTRLAIRVDFDLPVANQLGLLLKHVAGNLEYLDLCIASSTAFVSAADPETNNQLVFDLVSVIYGVYAVHNQGHPLHQQTQPLHNQGHLLHKQGRPSRFPLKHFQWTGPFCMQLVPFFMSIFDRLSQLQRLKLLLNDTNCPNDLLPNMVHALEKRLLNLQELHLMSANVPKVSDTKVLSDFLCTHRVLNTLRLASDFLSDAQTIQLVLSRIKTIHVYHDLPHSFGHLQPLLSSIEKSRVLRELVIETHTIPSTLLTTLLQQHNLSCLERLQLIIHNELQNEPEDMLSTFENHLDHFPTELVLQSGKGIWMRSFLFVKSGTSLYHLEEQISLMSS